MKKNRLGRIGTALALFATSLNLAAQGQGGKAFQDGINIAAGVIIAISIIWSVTTAWGGIHRIKEGDPSGKNAIWAAILIFIIPLIIFAVVKVIFTGAPSVSPNFSF